MNISSQFSFRLTTGLMAVIAGLFRALGFRLATKPLRDSNFEVKLMAEKAFIFINVLGGC